RAVALERELDQPVEQRGVGQAARLPQPREHRRLGEARQAVDLVDEEGAARALHQEVDAAESLAVEDLAGADREALHLARLLLVELRRDEELRVLVDVLRLVVVELVAGADLARQRGLEALAAEQRDLDLARVDRRLDEDLGVVARRLLERGQERRVFA